MTTHSDPDWLETGDMVLFSIDTKTRGNEVGVDLFLRVGRDDFAISRFDHDTFIVRDNLHPDWASRARAFGLVRRVIL